MKAIKETPTSNTIVKELNAAVLTGTFKNIVPGKKYKADVYQVQGSLIKEIVAESTCQPVNATYIETIEIEF